MFGCHLELNEATWQIVAILVDNRSHELSLGRLFIEVVAVLVFILGLLLIVGVVDPLYVGRLAEVN